NLRNEVRQLNFDRCTYGGPASQDFINREDFDNYQSKSPPLTFECSYRCILGNIVEITSP
ncbi:hypothetical protein, partial [Porphyromonas sp.]|uniref:hypothetical protein n=1 Tax=Porphyromonas sp. TaxID=1924944 RepID=UPI0026DAA299